MKNLLKKNWQIYYYFFLFSTNFIISFSKNDISQSVKQIEPLIMKGEYFDYVYKILNDKSIDNDFQFFKNIQSIKFLYDFMGSDIFESFLKINFFENNKNEKLSFSFEGNKNEELSYSKQTIKITDFLYQKKISFNTDTPFGRFLKEKNISFNINTFENDHQLEMEYHIIFEENIGIFLKNIKNKKNQQIKKVIIFQNHDLYLIIQIIIEKNEIYLLNIIFEKNLSKTVLHVRYGRDIDSNISMTTFRNQISVGDNFDFFPFDKNYDYFTSIIKPLFNDLNNKIVQILNLKDNSDIE